MGHCLLICCADVSLLDCKMPFIIDVFCLDFSWFSFSNVLKTVFFIDKHWRKNGLSWQEIQHTSGILALLEASVAWFFSQ